MTQHEPDEAATWATIAAALHEAVGLPVADMADWSGYPKVVGPDHVLNDLSDLALMLGGDSDSFTGDLLRLIAKARYTPDNLNRLVAGFPRHVAAFLMWTNLSFGGPITAGRLVEILSTVHQHLSPDDELVPHTGPRKDQP